MSDEVDKHIEDTLDHVRKIYKDVAKIIGELKSGEKIPATELAKQVAAAYGKTGPQLYPTIEFVLKDFPGTTRKRGVYGGIWKL